ncbi:MAG: lactate racemase domain-containing protein [Desulfobacterales bacterium]
MLFSDDKIREIINAGLPARLIENKRILVLTPDATRTCPLKTVVHALGATLGPRAAKLDFLVAVGTHPILSEEEILALYGIREDSRSQHFGRSDFFCHRWDLPGTLMTIGRLSETDVVDISRGRLRETVSIEINKLIYDYDLILIAGPVFPHEVVGFSGGAKYLFPGISGGELLHFFHWLGAVITTREIIGRKDTPVRQVIQRAMQKIERPLYSLSMVVHPHEGLQGLFCGDVQSAWSAAADLSATLHIVTKPRPYDTILGRAPEMYDEIWTAGKVMYKLEQVAARGGKLIIYAPHIHRFSKTWGTYIEKIGYHIRDYFLTRMDRFKDIPRGVLAHATHVRGTGTYHNGVEQPDVQVVLATAIPRERCEQVNLGYMDPAQIRIADYTGKEDQGILYVPDAGEILFRLENDA